MEGHWQVLTDKIRQDIRYVDRFSMVYSFGRRRHESTNFQTGPLKTARAIVGGPEAA